MTVILEELRRLEEAHRRGDVSTAEYDDLRSAVTSLVEEAEILDDRSNPSQETCIDAGLDTEMPEIPHVVQLGVLVCLAIVAIIGVLGWLLQDLTLALTLCVTLLAAVVVREARRLDDSDEFFKSIWHSATDRVSADSVPAPEANDDLSTKGSKPTMGVEPNPS